MGTWNWWERERERSEEGRYLLVRQTPFLFFLFVFFFLEIMFTSIPIIQTILLYTVSWVSFVCYL